MVHFSVCPLYICICIYGNFSTVLLTDGKIKRKIYFKTRNILLDIERVVTQILNISCCRGPMSASAGTEGPLWRLGTNSGKLVPIKS